MIKTKRVLGKDRIYSIPNEVCSPSKTRKTWSLLLEWIENLSFLDFFCSQHSSHSYSSESHSLFKLEPVFRKYAFNFATIKFWLIFNCFASQENVLVLTFFSKFTSSPSKEKSILPKNRYLSNLKKWFGQNFDFLQIPTFSISLLNE